MHLHDAIASRRSVRAFLPDLPAPWRERRFRIGEQMYARLGIPREDKAARRRWFARNFAFLDAPMALLCSVERFMGPPQWADTAHPVDGLVSERAPLEETVRWHGL